jgi:hypothetical protein
MAVELKKETRERISLHKEKASKVILDKGLSAQKSEVALVLDISGSMKGMLTSGLVQRVMQRVLALALSFDDDGQADFFLFHHQAFHHPDPISLDNIEDIVAREVLPKYPLGATNYAPVIEMLRKSKGRNTGWLKVKKKGGFLGVGGTKSFEGDPPAISPAATPSYVLFITDGANADPDPTELAVREAAYDPIFWQFVGIGGASFPFLEKLDDLTGRFIDNADFIQVNDVDSISDEELYGRLLQEYPGWLKEARAKSLLS